MQGASCARSSGSWCVKVSRARAVRPLMIVDTQSTLADLTESWRRRLQNLLYTRVLCGYRVGCLFTSFLSHADCAIAFFVPCLRRVLCRPRPSRRSKTTRAGVPARLHTSRVLWAHHHNFSATTGICLSFCLHGRRAAELTPLYSWIHARIRPGSNF